MDLNGIDLNLLVVFEAIYEDRSVTRASARLCITQSATSNALARLRNAFDDKLFIPTAKGMTPTPFADDFAPKVRLALNQLRSALLGPGRFDATTSSRTFNVRLTDMSEMLFLPKFLKHLQDIAPGVGIKSVRVSLEQLRDRLLSGEIDVAIGFLPGIGQGVMTQGLFEDRYVCAVRHGHPLEKEPMTIDIFRHLNHLLVEPQGSGNNAVHEAYARHGVSIARAVTVSHLVSVPFIISETDMIVAIPERLGQAFAGSARLSLLEPPFEFPRFVVRQHWHERFQNDDANIWLRRTIEAVSASVAGTGSKPTLPSL